MSEEKYCHSCGAKLNIDSKFCHKCGTESINSDEEIRNTKQAEENSNSSLQEQYIDIIHEKILFAYVNSVGLDLVYLYRNAPIYQFTNEMVDKYVKEFQSKVDSLEKYLSKQYINGNLIMLDTDEAIIKQISTYAFSIGFESDEDIELIRNKFFRVHRIEEKCELLHSIIEKYAIEGVIHYDLIDEYAIDKESFKNNELRRLCNAINEIEKMQISFHENSDNIDLSNEEFRKLYEKGYSLGFQKKIQVAQCILGIDKKNGYADKRDAIELQKQKEKDLNCFPQLSKKTTVLNKTINFEGGYFLKSYIDNYFQNKIFIMRAKFKKEMKNIDIKDEDFCDSFTENMFSIFSTADNAIHKIIADLELEDDEAKILYDSFMEIRKSFREDIYNFCSLFDEIDYSVQVKEAENQLRKENRGQWQLYGLGVKGGIQAGITQTLLNAGTGLAYDAINGISRSMSKHKANDTKMELLGVFYKVMEEYFVELKKDLVKIFFNAIKKSHPYCIWAPDKKLISTILDDFLREENKREKIELAFNLLHEDPYNKRTYLFLFSVILGSENTNYKENCAALINIISWFNIDKDSILSKVYSDQIQQLNSQYSFDDIKKIDRLVIIEGALGYRDKQQHNECCRKYLNSRIKKLGSYEPNVVNELVDFFHSFDKKYNYHSIAEKKSVIDYILSSHDIVTTSTDPIRLQKSLEHLKPIKDLYKFNLSVFIKKINDQLRKYLEKDLVVDYDLSERKYKTEKITLDSAYEIESFDKFTQQLKEYCNNLDPNSSEEEWNNAIIPIRELCIKNGYSEDLSDKLTNSYIKLDKDKRTVYGYIYKDLSDAKLAQQEVNFIESIYKKNNNLIVNYKQLLRYKFKTSSGKKAVLDKEAELIKKYNRNNTSNAGDVSVAFIKSLGLLLLSITLTIIFFFFMLDFKWYVIFISALVVLGSWGSFGDNVSDFLDEVDHSHETNSFVREFNKTFKIVDDHIQLK